VEEKKNKKKGALGKRDRIKECPGRGKKGDRKAGKKDGRVRAVRVDSKKERFGISSAINRTRKSFKVQTREEEKEEKHFSVGGTEAHTA